MASKDEAVRQVLTEGGEMTNEAVAEALKARFGIEVKPGIVAVIRASFRWKDLVAVKKAEAARLAAALAESQGEGKKKAAAG